MKITNLRLLTEDLLESYVLLKSDPRRASQVKELANVAGKVIGANKLLLEYNVQRAASPSLPVIDFLEPTKV